MKKILITGLMLPLFAFAQATGPVGNTLVQIGKLVEQVIPLLLSIAVLMFLWGIVKFIANIGDEAARKQGISMMVWGMIALFVMVSFWGIIGYVQQSFQLVGVPVVTGTAPPLTNPVPTVNP